MYLSILTTLILLSAPLAGAHETSVGHENATVERLEHFLEHERTQVIRRELYHEQQHAQEGGELLLAAVYEEVVEHAIVQGRPSVKQASANAVAAVIKKFNPIALGRWLISVGREHGAGLAIPYGISEVAEQVGILMTAKYPELAFLLPVYLTHMSDVVVFGAYFGIPKIARTIRTWKYQGGGILKGPRLYYRHLSEQRQVAPIDWSVVIESPESELARFVIINENRFERMLPRTLQILFTPRKLAQKEALPTLGLWELEGIARESLIALWPYKQFKHHRQIYTRLLLAEIAGNALARTKLSAILAERLLQAKEKPITSLLEVDVVAERWLWFLRNRRDQLKQDLNAQAMGALPEQRRKLRALSRLLDRRGSLLKIAATPVKASTLEQWQELRESLTEVDALFREIESTLPEPAAFCEKLLVSAETAH